MSATIDSVLELRDPRSLPVRRLLTETAVRQASNGRCGEHVVSLLVSCRTGGPRALLIPPVDVRLAPHPAVIAALGEPRRDGTWPVTRETFERVDPLTVAAGDWKSFARCGPASRARRLRDTAAAAGLDVESVAEHVERSAARTGPGWLVLDTSSGRPRLSWDAGSLTVGPLSRRRTMRERLELDELDELLEQAASCGVMCFETGTGGRLGALRVWQGEVAALRRGEVPAVVNVHLDASAAGRAETSHSEIDAPEQDGSSDRRPHGGCAARIASSAVVDAVEQLTDLGVDLVADETVTDCVSMSEAMPVGRRGLFAHQDHAVSRYLSTTRGMLLAFDPGAGKTPTACVALAESIGSGGCGAVIAPVGVCRQWEHELTAWTSLPFTMWTPGTSVPANGVVLCATTNAVAFAAACEKRDARFDDLVIDEARFLRANSEQTRACASLRRRSRRCLLLSATPARRQAGDYARLLSFARDEMWSPAAFNAACRHDLTCLDPVVVHGSLPDPRSITYHTHRSEACDDLDQIEALGFLLGELRSLEAGRSAHAPLDGAGVRRAHRGRTLIALEAAMNSLTRRWAQDSSDLVAETAAASRTATLVFASSPTTRAMVVERVRSAGTSALALERGKDADAAAQAFQSGDCDVLVVGSAGQEGLNLTRAQRVLLGDLPFEPGVLRQRVGRAARIGHDGSALDVHLFAPSRAAACAARALVRGAGQPLSDGGALAVAAACCANL